MKRLNEFIYEHTVNEAENNVPASKTFTFKLADLEDTKDVLEKVNGLEQKDGVTVTVEETTVTVEVTKEGVENTGDVKSAISDFVKVCNNSGHRASSESYAQRLAAVEKELTEVDKYAEDVKGEATADDNKE